MAEERRKRRKARKSTGRGRGRGPAPVKKTDEEVELEAASEAGGDGIDAPELEDEVVEPINALPEITLSELSEPIQQACARAGWPELMPVQAKTIPYFLARRDLMIQSRTGSGKTGAFLLPILDRIDARRPATQALILVPTRELAVQVSTEAEILLGNDVRSIAVYGGVGYGKQMDAFRKGAHVVVGTPGRVLDHLLKGSMNLNEIEILVFDEADRMLSMGFYPDMKRVKRYLPDRDRNTYMFSATFPFHVMRLAGEFLRETEMLSLSQDRVHVSGIEHVVINVPDMKKDRVLVRLIEMENPARAIVFCNTKAEVNYVTLILQRFGYDAAELSSELDQKKREKVLGRLRKGQLKFLVSTDVAARGIDIPEISHIFQYDIPEDPEAYVHRAGRTARAGAGGKAISLAYVIEKMRVTQIKDKFGVDFLFRDPPTDEDVEAIVTQRVTALLEAQLRGKNHLERERMERFLPLGRTLADNEDESALVAMLLDDYYQQSLHRPLVEEEESEEQPGSSASSSKSGGRGRRRDFEDGGGGRRGSGGGSSRGGGERKGRGRRRG